jgi:hypothetical protein
MKGCGLALALLAAVLGLRFGTFVASGADSYGYVSQADLWLERSLIIDQPLGADAPWRYAVFTLAPLGYRPGDRRGTMVPTYSPGLPMAMALFKAVGGANAVYWVVPLLGALSVWLTFVLGARLAGPDAGLLAALALLVSPAFLFQLMWPMSDVPVMAWWLASIVLALGRGRLHVVGSGFAAAAAILTRPNLVLLAVPIAVMLWWREPRAAGASMASTDSSRRERVVRVLIFAVAALPGPIAIAAINTYLYESPLASGYGTFSTIYDWPHLWANLARYPRWLLISQTPFALLALAAPTLLRRHGFPAAHRTATFGLAFALVVFLSYLWYTPFDDWTYLRFLLPAYPLILAAAAAAFALLAPPQGRRRAVAFAMVAALLVGSGVWQGRHAFAVRAEESRYLAAGRFARGLPDNAAIICNQHSGSLRYYGNRVTLRYEWLEPDVYVQAIEYLRALGRPVFVVLDDSERDAFRARYSGVADITWLDEPPVLVAAKRVYFYAVP